MQHLPATETMFQASTVGLQTTEGYSFVEISFPGSITQVMIRITPRSSSASDSWLVDNLVLTGELPCTASTSSITEIACDSYMAPSGATYTSSAIFDDTIPGVSGCDSIITIDLTVNVSTSSSISESGLDIYTAPSGATYTSTGTYMDTIPNAAGCDSVITIDLVMNYTGLDDLAVSTISVFPNPVSEVLNIKGLNALGEIRSIIIVDLNGELIKEIKSSESIDVSRLAPGVYFVQVEHENGIEKTRFIKE